ncbi:MAG: asparagine synthase (glutamine-hydrolyzing) [Myxococcales bacterium]|nr:asparagine synthase (glutamine-hydrolyzing) [Myxococcales bacterium]
MCGIIALVSHRGPVDRLALDRGLDAIAHRGPDGRGTWLATDGAAALGHTRLAIIDLEGGAQPLFDEGRRRVLVANGEIYDHDRLLDALGARGHALGTRSDSETILHLFEEHGPEALPLLRGELAFVLWDTETRTLTAVRDRFGIKPLFYAVHAGVLRLASEVKALFAAGHPARWSDEGVFQALHLSGHADRTLYDGVFQVPPGHRLTWHAGEITLSRYWDADFARSPITCGLTEAELIHETGRRLEEAIRLRLRADVPVACYLSGGIDSSSVLGFANLRLLGGAARKVAAFTVCFEHPEFDEDDVAAEMAAYAGADYHPVRVTNRDFADVFEDAVAAGEGFQYNGHAPARFLLSRAVSAAGFKVAMGGEGADEVFLGYHFAERAVARSLDDHTPGPLDPRTLWRLANRLRATSPAQRDLAGISPLLALVTRIVGFPDDLLAGLVAQATRLRSLVAPEFLQRFHGRDAHRELLQRFEWRDQILGREPARQLVYLWLRSIFPNYVLAGERLDMAHGVELRLPFLDHHLFEFAARLPAKRLHRGGRNKYLLRQTAQPYVTERVAAGAKRPFFAPPSSLYPGNPLTALILDHLHSDGFAGIPFFDAGAVRRLVDSTRRLPDAERAAYDPLFYLLGSAAVLHRRFGLAG